MLKPDLNSDGNANAEVQDMANEDKKDFNEMLRRDNGMPKIQIVTDAATIKKVPVLFLR